MLRHKILYFIIAVVTSSFIFAVLMKLETIHPVTSVIFAMTSFCLVNLHQHALSTQNLKTAALTYKPRDKKNSNPPHFSKTTPVHCKQFWDGE